MENSANTIYVRPETLARLLASGRVHVLDDGTPVFGVDDRSFPAMSLILSEEVTGHAAHRRVWSGYDRGHVFEFVGYV